MANTPLIADNLTIAGSLIASSSMMFRNKVINGSMSIDQRNNGAAVSITGITSKYCIDRFYGRMVSVGSGSFTVQQVTDKPTGFSNSLKITVTTAQTMSTNQFCYIGQVIEGYNIADLCFGTASAKEITLSFWVKSSLTGTFGGFFAANTLTSRPFSYTINAANTWEYKTVTVKGDNYYSTWLSNNGVGLQFGFSIGCGTAYRSSSSFWEQPGGSGQTFGHSNQIDVIATANATIQFTGVQLEIGSYATPFELRSMGTERTLCERYYEGNTNIVQLGGYLPAYPVPSYGGGGVAAGEPIALVNFRQSKRDIPTFNVYSTVTGAIDKVRTPGVDNTVNYTYAGQLAVTPYFASIFNNTGGTFPYVSRMHFTYSADADYSFL